MKIVIMIFVIFFAYIACGMYIIKSSNSFELISLSVSPSLEWYDDRAIPLPFRQELAIREFKSRELSDFHPKFTSLYNILGFGFENSEVGQKSQDVLAELAEHLIDVGMDINARDIYGCTALQSAQISKDYWAVEFLLSKNASTESYRLANKGQTICHEELLELLKTPTEKNKPHSQEK